MYYLYGSKRSAPSRLVAIFGSEEQLLAYAGWATLENHSDQRGKFEQGSALAGCEAWTYSTAPLTDDDEEAVPFNPSPSML